MYASISPQISLMETTCCLGNLMGPEVSGDEAMQHPHSHHLGVVGSPEAAVGQRLVSGWRAEVWLGDTGRPRYRRQGIGPPSGRTQAPCFCL